MNFIEFVSNDVYYPVVVNIYSTLEIFTNSYSLNLSPVGKSTYQTLSKLPPVFGSSDHAVPPFVRSFVRIVTNTYSHLVIQFQ